MPFVGCPKNSDVVSNGKTNISSSKRYRRDGKTPPLFGSQVTAPWSESRASKHGVGGKMVLVNNKPWSPTRPYTRSASLVIYEPGTTICYDKSSDQFEIWQGYPAPSSIWSPSDGLLLAAPSGDFTVDSFGVPTLSAKSMARINTGLLVKAGDRKVNIGNFLAESGETLKMLATAVKKLVRAYRAVRKGQFGRALKTLASPNLAHLKGKSFAKKAVSEVWLEFIYGWKPLMADIYDLFNVLQKGLNIKPQMLSVRRRISTVDVANDVNISGFASRYTRTTGTLYGKMWYKISSSDITFWNRLGLINPAEPFWEALPFSFLVDWLVPVSSYLEALSARVGLDFVDGYYGCKQDTMCILSRVTHANSGYTVLNSSCVTRRETTGYRRTKMSSLPWPDVWFKSPFSTLHVLNALALMKTLKKH